MFYYAANTGETSYDLPTEPKFAVKVANRSSNPEWSELWDSRTNERGVVRPGNYYYYNNYSAESTNEKPPLFAKQSLGEQPVYLTAIQKLQNMVRNHQGRRRVRVQRATRHMDHVGSHLRWERLYDPHARLNYWYDIGNGNIRWDEPDQGDMYDYSLPKGEHKNYVKYSKVWDPRTHAHYFFNNWAGTSQFDVPHDWAPEMALDMRKPPILKASLAMQCMFRRRAIEQRMRVARNARENMSPGDRQKEVAKRAEEMARKEAQALVRREREKERSANMAMAKAELEQSSKGDKFWGIDFMKQAQQHRLEVERRMKLQEEERKKREEEEKRKAIERRKEMFAGRKVEMLAERERMREMTREEAAQRAIDRFWGVDRAELDRRERLKKMIEQDEESRSRENFERLDELHKLWLAEFNDQKRAKNLNLARDQTATREKYMGDFYLSHSSQNILSYRWPSSTFVSHLPNRWETTGFRMDEVYDTTRIDAPASVFHALNSIRSAPPKAARDFLLSVEDKGFNLLPHMHKIHDKTGVPPEIDAREIASRQRTASSSLLAANHLEWMEISGKSVSIPKMPEIDVTTKPGRLKKLKNRKGSQSTSALNRTEADGMTGEPSNILSELSVGMGLKGSKSTAVLAPITSKTSTTGKKKRADPNRIFRKKKKSVRISSKERRRMAREAEENRVKFNEEQRKRFKHIFNLIDEDKSGSVDKHELMTALRINDEVISLVKMSPLLQPLLRDRDFARTFMAMDTDGEGGITFEEFEAFLLSTATKESVQKDDEVFQQMMEDKIRKNAEKERESNEMDLSASVKSDGKLANEDALLQRIFNTVDQEGTGKMGKREFLFAFKSMPDVKKLCLKSQTLGPLSKRKGFNGAMMKLKTVDEDNMNFEEFKSFCIVGFKA